MAEATLGIGNYIEIRPQVKKKKDCYLYHNDSSIEKKWD